MINFACFFSHLYNVEKLEIQMNNSSLTKDDWKNFSDAISKFVGMKSLYLDFEYFNEKFHINNILGLAK